MQRTSAMMFAIASLLPVASVASEVVLPELGIRLTGLPISSRKPQVTERPAGYEGTVQISPTTVLIIYRADDPIPPGNFTDASYRSSLFAKLDDSKAGTVKGTLTSVGGHEAWAIVDAERVGPLAAYRYTAYLTADQHLYRITVTALGSQRPAEFDAAVKAVSSSIAFEPVQRSADSASPGVPGAMPRFVSGGHEAYYPASSVRRGEQGIVDVEFSIDSRGHVRDVKETYAASRDLGHSAAAQLQDGVFRVPADWVQTASDRLRFTMEFQFELAGRGSSCPTPETPPRVAGAKVMGICHSDLPGR
jgi:hypothetical protein